MKPLRAFLVLGLFVFSLGCIEVQEDLSIQPSGSGQLDIRTDMSQLLELMQMYLGGDSSSRLSQGAPTDTTLSMVDLMDSSKTIPAEQKALLRNAHLQMTLDPSQKVFKTHMSLPFSSVDHLQQLYNMMRDGSLGSGSLLKSNAGLAKTDTSLNGLSNYNSLYEYQCRDGLISRKLNAQRWQQFQQDPQYSKIKEVTTLGFEMPYIITIHIPRPVKKVDNALANLSADRKTVTIRYNMAEVFTNPEKFEYTIVY